MAQDNVIDRPLDCATRRVPHDDDELGAGHVAGELHAAQDVFVDDIPSEPGVERIADAEIADHLDRRPGIYAGQRDRGGV